MDFAGWVGAAAPGDRLEYHRGFLTVDTIPMISKLPETDRAALKQVRGRAWWASEQRLVHLVQERLGPDLFAYIAIARPKPKRAEVSLAALLVDAEAASARSPIPSILTETPDAVSEELSPTAGPGRPATPGDCGAARRRARDPAA